jgi:branched-chain amino acid transport system permease protein
MALGLTTIYNATKVINFAQGEFLILGAGLMYSFTVVVGMPMILAVVLTLLACTLFSCIVEQLIMLPVTRSGSRYAWIITTLALALILEASFGLYYAQATLKPEPYISGKFTLGGTDITYQELLLIVVTAIVVACYGLFLNRTLFGRAVRATGYDSDTAQLMGVGTKSVMLASFMIGGLVTVVAGILISPIYFITPTSGLTYVLAGFVAMIIGGLGSVAGSLTGGLIVGLLYSAVENLIDAQYSQMIVVALLVAILVVRPQGIFRSPLAAGGVH